MAGFKWLGSVRSCHIGFGLEVVISVQSGSYQRLSGTLSSTKATADGSFRISRQCATLLPVYCDHRATVTAYIACFHFNHLKPLFHHSLLGRKAKLLVVSRPSFMIYIKELFLEVIFKRQIVTKLSYRLFLEKENVLCHDLQLLSFLIRS